MTIEEEFFKAFEIEPIGNIYECRCGTNTTKHTIHTCKSDICDKKYCDQEQTGVYYPQITAEKLLQMICIYFNNNYDDIGFVENVEELKNKVLKWMICFKPHPNDEFKREDVIKYVRKLFEE